VSGGVNGRIVHGEIDKFGREVVEDPVTTNDFDATIPQPRASTTNGRGATIDWPT
jgi:Protein of unknown function (DUF1501)